MGLEQIRQCSIQYSRSSAGKRVHISGICKETSTHQVVTVSQEQYDQWIEKRWPARTVFTDLTLSEINFLATGIWK